MAVSLSSDTSTVISLSLSGFCFVGGNIMMRCNPNLKSTVLRRADLRTSRDRCGKKFGALCTHCHNPDMDV